MSRAKPDIFRSAKNMLRNTLYYILLFAIIFAAGILYSPSLDYPFVWDDKAVIRDNHYLRSPGSIGLFFQRSFWRNRLPISRFDYRPLQMIVLSSISRLGGQEPVWFRSANILLHLLIIWFIWNLALRIGCGRRTAFFASALFAFHPVHVEAVVNARNISELMMVALLMISLMLFLKKSSGVYLWFSSLFFLAALLCKESALIYPAVLTFTALTFREKTTPGYAFRRTIPFWLIAAGGAAAKIYISTEGPLRDNPLCSNFIVGSVRLIGIYLRLLIFPIQLKVLYPFDRPISWAEPEWFMPILAAAGLLFLLYKLFRNNRVLFWALACLLLSLLPTLAKIGQLGRVVAEQRLYFPSIFFCVAGAALLSPTEIFRNNSRRILRTATSLAAAVICLCFAWLTRDYLPSWRSDLALWTRVTILSPRSALAYNNLATVYHRQKNDDRAILELKEALRYSPRHKESHSNMGLLHKIAGREDEAIFEFKESLQSDPSYYPASLHLAEIYLKQRRLDEAEEVLRGVLKQNNYLPQAHNALAIVLEEKGQSGEAETHYREAYQLNPEYVVALRNLTALYHERKDYDRAIKTGREAIEKNPSHPNGYMVLARVYTTAGRFNEARSILRKGLRRNPGNWKIKSLLMALETE